jgi:nitroimidazol reductase NimA-like FMN-containing flavoprotein (pyridoxamine 5'-phosphate oxidase superfamily)
MRRQDKEITDSAAIDDIIRRASVCRLAVSENDRPYVVPLCFGYNDNTLYFHSANEGRKLGVLAKNNNVCFEMDIDHEVVKGDLACTCGMNYRSVIGFGKAVLVDDLDAKREAFGIIMGHYAAGPFEFPADVVENTAIIKVEIETMTGKQSGYE